MTNVNRPCFLVLKFENGAKCVHKGFDEAKAREVYASLESATLVASTGRDENGDPIPGVMMDNATLARKFHGEEQIEGAR